MHNNSQILLLSLQNKKKIGIFSKKIHFFKHSTQAQPQRGDTANTGHRPVRIVL
jgi:hypothetical protein